MQQAESVVTAAVQTPASIGTPEFVELVNLHQLHCPAATLGLY